MDTFATDTPAGDTENAFSHLSPSLRAKLEALSILSPTPVQQRVIPRLASGENLLFQSETGTGKTFAYLLPLINAVEKQKSAAGGVKILIASPTVELSSQIRDAVKSITDIKCALFVGGAPLRRQAELLKENPEIAVGNPARLLELARLKKLKLAHLYAAVFDEADRLVKKEIKADLASLVSLFPNNVQIVGCSATVTKAVRDFFSDCESISMPEEDVLRKRISHWAIYAESRDKIDTLKKLFAALDMQKALVFTSRGDQVENIASKLKYKNIDCEALYAKEDKKRRKRAIDRFKSGSCRILITSDVASRGLDFQNVSHVIQTDLNDDDDFFIHRAGRTGRAGKTGINIVIGDEYEMRRYSALEKRLKITVYPKVLYRGEITAPDAVQAIGNC